MIVTLITRANNIPEDEDEDEDEEHLLRAAQRDASPHLLRDLEEAVERTSISRNVPECTVNVFSCG